MLDQSLLQRHRATNLTPAFLACLLDELAHLTSNPALRLAQVRLYWCEKRNDLGLGIPRHDASHHGGMFIKGKFQAKIAQVKILAGVLFKYNIPELPPKSTVPCNIIGIDRVLLGNQNTFVLPDTENLSIMKPHKSDDIQIAHDENLDQGQSDDHASRSKAVEFLAGNSSEQPSFTYEEEKSVLRRIDSRVLILVLWAYFFQQLDKSTLRYLTQNSSPGALSLTSITVMSPFLESQRTLTWLAFSIPGSALFYISLSW